MSDISIQGYVPGAIGRVAELHARYYGEHWDFGLYFEAKVATGLAEFLQRQDHARDGFWTVSQGGRAGRVVGAIAIDGAQSETLGAHLRWFILAEELRGRKLGSRLLREAVDFCICCGHPRIYLWTFQGLDPARRLYEKFGFQLTEEREGQQWGKKVLEQRFVLELG